MNYHIENMVKQTHSNPPLDSNARNFGTPLWFWNGFSWEATDSMGVYSQVVREPNSELYLLQRFERGAWVTTSKDRDPKRLLACLA